MPEEAPRAAPARHLIAVGSGKGGVGKSTVSLNLAHALAAMGSQVGILDADLYGPNIPLMVGITRHSWTEYWTLARRHPVQLEPVERYGLKIASAGFILGEDQPLTMEGLSAQMLIGQLLTQVRWGPLDYLVVDLPPGTADIQQQLLKAGPFDGAVVVVTPQYVAHLDARKAVQMYRRAGVRVLGGIENMADMACPHCGRPIQVFPAVPPERSIWSMEVERLGSIPLDPALALAGDRGEPLLTTDPDSVQARAFHKTAERLVAVLEGSEGQPQD